MVNNIRNNLPFLLILHYIIHYMYYIWIILINCVIIVKFLLLLSVSFVVLLDFNVTNLISIKKTLLYIFMDSMIGF